MSTESPRGSPMQPIRSASIPRANSAPRAVSVSVSKSHAAELLHSPNLNRVSPVPQIPSPNGTRTAQISFHDVANNGMTNKPKSTRRRAMSEVVLPSWSVHDSLDIEPLAPIDSEKFSRRRSEAVSKHKPSLGLERPSSWDHTRQIVKQAELEPASAHAAFPDGIVPETEAPLVPYIRRIKHFRTLALAVRAWISLLPKSYREAEAIFETTPDGKNQLKAATLDAIITSLTPVDSVDPDHIREILLTLRYFSEPEVILDKLIARFHQKTERSSSVSAGARADKDDIVPLRVINVLKRWLKEFFYDFDRQGHLLEKIINFLDKDVVACEESVSRWVEPIKRIIAEQSLGTSNLKRSTSAGLIQAIDDKKDGRTFAEFTNINPVDVFRQLTLTELELFQAVTPRDLYFKTAKRDGDKSPTLMALIEKFNHISFWVAKEICFCANSKQRLVVLKRFIHIAQLCVEWKNFNTCLEIVGGLSMGSVQRMKKTWKSLPSKYASMWKDLQRITSPRQNYITYRTLIKTLQPPAFPYTGVYLSDLTYIQEKYPTKLAGGLINVTKLRMLAQVIIDFQKFQSTATFPFIENPHVKQFLKNDTEVVSEDALYQASRVSEPTSAEAPDSGKNTLMSQSGLLNSSFTIGRWRGTVTPIVVRQKDGVLMTPASTFPSASSASLPVTK